MSRSSEHEGLERMRFERDQRKKAKPRRRWTTFILGAIVALVLIDLIRCVVQGILNAWE